MQMGSQRPQWGCPRCWKETLWASSLCSYPAILVLGAAQHSHGHGPRGSKLGADSLREALTGRAAHHPLLCETPAVCCTPFLRSLSLSPYGHTHLLRALALVLFGQPKPHLPNPAWGLVYLLFPCNPSLVLASLAAPKRGNKLRGSFLNMPSG